ncbi:MAG: histidine phosphatase family protein [Deltaproteobacteria bacterium]
MELLIIRHGDAVEDAPGLGDVGRWLTGKGRKTTRHVGSWLAASDARRPVEIWTSPLVRSVQTAEILAEAAGLTDEVCALAALSTHGDPDAVLRAVAQHRHTKGPLALVGHEPSLSYIATQLLGDVPWSGFKKSGVLAVSWSGHGHATFRFLLHPKEMLVIDKVGDVR